MAKRWLLVDIGNSRVKWANADGDSFHVGSAFPSAFATLRAQLDQHWRGLAAPDAVYIANVTGTATAELLTAWIAEHWRVPVRFARSVAAAEGVVNGYTRPEQLGVDRWVGLIALRHEAELPACLVDCGTALTFDLLDQNGQHRGGLIAPGLALMKQVLLKETHGVTEVEAQMPEALGRDTAAGVESGVLLAAAGLVEKAWREAYECVGVAPDLVLVGGDAARLGACLAMPYRLLPDLVLRGLLILAESDS